MRPEFRAAAHLAAEMRGFDLGDDARLLGLDLAPLKRGILLYRAGHWPEAQDLLDQADGPVAGFLSCFCTARLRTPQAALDSLPWSTDEDLDEATLGWGKGELLWAAGRLEEAEQALAFSACLGASRDLARLRYAQGRFSDALEAYRLLGREEPVLGALLHLAQGDAEEARRCLDQASSAQLDEARKDPRLRALKIPRRGRSRDRQGGLEMLSKKDSRLYTKRLRERYSGAWPLGIKWTDPLWEWCQERVKKAVVVALGPANAKRAGGDLPTALVQDGETFYLAPNLEIPPPLWPPVQPYSATETLPFQVERALESFRNTRRPRLSLPCRTRAFMGYREATLVPSPYSGDWQEAGPHELDRHWTFSPCVDSYPWGGAYSDDPWPETIPEQPDLQLKLVARLEEVRQQAQGGISTFTMRTVASRSQISTEYHPGGCYVWEIRYHPNPWPEVVDSFNARLDVSFPNSLPVDVVGALYGFEFSPLAQLWQLMEAESEPSALAGWIDLLAATGHNDLRTAYRLRRHLSHPALPVRAALANVAVRYNWMFVLRELWLKETDQAFADWMRGHYENGAPPPPLNQLGEPIE
jgi:tetratricopeptide (TPR) repeat protein